MNRPFEHRHSAHCESGVTAALLGHAGLELSEPMAFGLGGGLYFFYTRLVKIVGMPLVSFRTYPGTIFRNTCRRLGVATRRHTFWREEQGVRALDRLLEQGVPVGLQACMFWLHYFPREFRSQFNGHNLIGLRREGDEYLLSDPVLQEPVRCEASLLRRARFARGALAPRGVLYYPTSVPSSPDLDRPIRESIDRSARTMLSRAGIVGVGAIRRLARHVRSWPRRHPDGKQSLLLLGHVVRMQEEVGTGGAGFRFMYASFLQEAAARVDHAPYLEASRRMTEVGDQWRQFAVVAGRLIKDRAQAGESFELAARHLDECADAEEAVYRHLIANAPARTAPAPATTATAPATPVS